MKTVVAGTFWLLADVLAILTDSIEASREALLWAAGKVIGP